jgi:hypothetical protein
MPKLVLLFIIAMVPGSKMGSSTTVPSASILAPDLVLEDFESYSAGDVPSVWDLQNSRQLIPITESLMNASENAFILEEHGNKFVRASTVDETFGLVLTNGNQFTWTLSEHPRLSWDWRAIRLPVGAREDQRSRNDTGGAIYVVFSFDFLGRPRSVKYTYSSAFPVDATILYDNIGIIVVGSKLDGVGAWQNVERDLYADYQRLFGKKPPEKPLAIVLWTDSDTMHDLSVIDFDNVALLGQIGVEE